MDRLFAFARMDAIESQIKALEDEYRALYQILTGVDMGRKRNVYGSKKFCEDCGQNLPLSEFYCRERYGGIYYVCRCKSCEKKRRNTDAYKRPRAESTNEQKPKKKVRPKNNYEDINDTQNEAAANGMSYGQWVAQQYLKEQRNEKEKR